LKQLFSFPFDNIVAEEYSVSIILPEGVTDIKYDLPFDVDDVTVDKYYSFLDYWGRSRITFTKKNVIGKHNLPITLSYKFRERILYTEPVILVGGFLVLFGLFILTGRL